MIFQDEIFKNKKQIKEIRSLLEESLNNIKQINIEFELIRSFSFEKKIFRIITTAIMIFLKGIDNRFIEFFKSKNNPDIINIINSILEFNKTLICFSEHNINLRIIDEDLLLELKKKRIEPYTSFESSAWIIRELVTDYKVLYKQLRDIFNYLTDIDKISKEISAKDKNIKDLKDKLEYLKGIKNIIFNFKVKHLNLEIQKISRELFEHSNFTTILDKDYFPVIMFNDSEDVFPISVLSGGERAKLILAIFSLFAKNNFFLLIDEPNELFDLQNIELVKYFLFKLFQNKQLIICTFIENYRNFQPALIYKSYRDGEGSNLFRFTDKS